MTEALSHLFAYIENGTSAYHVVSHTEGVLQAAGFQRLSLRDAWKLETGGRYYVTPFPTTLYAFTIGEKGVDGQVRLAGAHTDFPAIKVKPDPDLNRRGLLQLNTEVYGGPILNTWFDRPLSLSGRVAVRKQGGGVNMIPVDLKRPCLYLPNLAVHMNRGVNEEGKPINNQKELLPFVMLTDEKPENHPFRALLAEEVQAESEEILDYDLCVYNPVKPALVGWKEDFVSAPRLDDISSCSALIHGLVEGGGNDGVSMVCLFDNEEVGSRSKQGADSAMPRLILAKLFRAFSRDATDALSAAAEGYFMSVDVAHAWHPNYPETQDITNYPLAGKGFCLKSASNQSYAWDAEALAFAADLCLTHGIPFQRFAKHSNTKGGGTIGSILSSQVPMRTVDMGIGLLAMHSAQEMMAKADQDALEGFAKAYFGK